MSSDKDADSSDNEAPDDVSFATSRTKVLDAARATRDSLQLQNDRRKLKLQKRQELMEQQKLAKKKRLDELASKALSLDVLESVSSINEFKEQKAKEFVPTNLSIEETLEDLEFNNPLPATSTVWQKEKSDRKWNKKQNNKREDGNPSKEFIPLVSSNATDFRVKVINEDKRGMVANLEELRNLKNRLLMGQDVQRITTKDMVLHRKKKRLYEMKNNSCYEYK